MEERNGLDAARDALGRHSWSEAFDLFMQAEEDLSAEDLEGLAECAWWTARLDDCIEARERAFELHSAQGNDKRAGLTAIWLAKDHFARGESSIGMAWFRRAEALLRDIGPCVEAGHLERMRSVMAFEGDHDYQTALDRAEAAIACAELVGDRDLLAMSVHDKGRALIGLGRLDEGSALMDEANVAAVAGELSPFWTACVFCNTITMCKEISDYSRASDWTVAAKRWCERQAIAGFPGMCRVYRAGILRVRGEWREALDEAQRAADETATFNLSYAAQAFNELGEVRLEMGDLAGAEDAFGKASELGRDPQPGLARLQHERGNTRAASMGLKRCVQEHDAPLERAPLLPTAVELAIATGDIDAARTYVEELQSTSQIYRTLALQAAAATAEGRLRLATGDIEGAVTILRRAAQSWRKGDMPYEMARARELLARALMEAGDGDAAAMEESAARSVLARLSSEAGVTAGIDPAPPAPSRGGPTSEDAPCLRKDGEYWKISFGGDEFLLRDSKGLHHLARLLGNPGREHHVLDLARSDAGPMFPEGRSSEGALETSSGDAGAVLDPAAKAAYKARLEDLRAELQEAEDWGDEGRAARARQEIEFIAAELASAVGLGGRDRKAASTTERARLNVTRSIRSAIGRISDHSSVLGEHLAATVKTGTFCAYTPDPRSPIAWDTGSVHSV